MDERATIATTLRASASHPCASLALAVLEQAIRDFAPPSHVIFGGPDRNLTITRVSDVERVECAAEAGEFILTRTDAIVAHWCELIGVSIVEWRKQTNELADWHAHLVTIQERLRAHRMTHGQQPSLF